MGRISDKVRQILGVQPADSVSGEHSSTIKAEKTSFPAGRVDTGMKIEIPERTLTANMTGQVTLSGYLFDMHFNKGSLKRISSEASIIFDRLNSRTFFTTDEEDIQYRNESAFAFDSENEYGLRTLQIPKNRNYDCRVFTDFIFSRLTEKADILLTADYPEFDNDVTSAALFEFSLRNSNKSGITISSDSSEPEVIKPDTETSLEIVGKQFEISTNQTTVSLAYAVDTNLNTLAVKTGSRHGRKVLFINPGGSYTRAPADFYSGVTEQINIRINFRKN
ncbi:MAG: hypothetical protein PQJ61_15175 [Spirochaetales bacterium]|uniref:Uncharacterized protein n=1 Tax=Candidatus Thalassospirochaeta sargassi TaxID=3119039 RepID=A0AAJ1IF32_9SPIO|nr:hypothetical protein [Spirochaetales bacterium]